MGKLSAILVIALWAGVLVLSCASSARYVSEKAEPEDTMDVALEEEPPPPPPVEENSDIWPDLEIFHVDTTYTSVDSSAANRAMRLRWRDVVEILESKNRITTAEAYLLARAYHETRQYVRALELFDQIAGDTAFVLQPYVQIGAIAALAELDSVDAVLLRSAELPAEFIEQGMAIRYQVYLSKAQNSKALTMLDSLNAVFPGHFGNLEYRLARANLLRETGDKDSAVDGYLYIVRNNSGSYALSAAKALDEMNRLKGRDLYYAGNAAVSRNSWATALDYLGRYIETGESYKRGEARYYHARAMGRRGNYSKAIDLYKKIIDEKAYNRAWAELGVAWCYRKQNKFDSARIYTHKAISSGSGSNAEAEALWEAVNLYIDLGDYDSAGYYGERLSRKYPNHSLGDNGAMWAGIGAFSNGDFSSAESRFAFIPKKYSDRTFIETGEYWAGISSLENGDSSGIAKLEKVARSPIRHYYKYRATANLGGFELPDPAKSTSEKWLSYEDGIAQARAVLEEKGHNPAVLSINSLNSRRASTFASMGLLYEAGTYFISWMNEVPMTPSSRIAFLELASEWKLSATAYQIALKLVSDMGGYANAPVEVVRLAYPTIFEEYVRPASESERIDPAFIFAIIRRESAFDPHVVSYAGAIGLCQFMPATGKMTAEQLGDGKIFETELLYDFETSVRYAARHVADLAGQFEKPEYILAAYNAGPHHVKRWLDFPHEDRIELFVESNDFAQTRHYMKNVLADYWAYKELWDSSIPMPTK